MIKSKSGLNVVKPGAVPSLANMGLGGVAGAGKTHLMGTLGPDGKLLIMDTEGGSTTYNSRAFQDDPNKTDNIDVVEFGDVKDCNDLIHRIEGTLDYLLKTRNKEGYNVVAVDSLTELQERFLSMHQANDPRQSYGAFKQALYGIVHKARQVNAHTVFTARLKATTDEVLNREIVRFDVAPSVWSTISGLFSLIGFLDVKRKGVGSQAKTVRYLDTSFNTRTPGKDRHDVGELQDPSFVEILKRIEGDK